MEVNHIKYLAKKRTVYVMYEMELNNNQLNEKPICCMYEMDVNHIKYVVKKLPVYFMYETEVTHAKYVVETPCICHIV